MKPSFGLTPGRTLSMFEIIAFGLCLVLDIMYAVTNVTEREIPIAQWISTFVCSRW